MNLNFSVEEFLEGIEKAKSFIPKKPTIVVKNATVTGVKLNSKIINSIPQSEEPISSHEGINVYQDDSLDKPRFIVEGEIEKKNYLKWEDLEFEKEEQWLKVKMGNNFYRMDWLIDDADIKEVNLYKYITNDYLVYCACIRGTNQQFFNDLRLERVEE